MSKTATPSAPGDSVAGSGDTADRATHDRRIALTVTTVGILAAMLNSSILIISLPAIFTGLGLDPLTPSNITYLLWMLMGYLLATSVLVVTFGRLGDQYGRARLFNLGFLIFTIGAAACALVPNSGPTGAIELILLRLVQGVGGAMLTANSTAIITDAFPADRRGFALGVNQVAGIGGAFLGLLVGGLLSNWHWRAVFWVSVPVGIWGTWAGYRTLHDKPRDRTHKVSMDWWGNAMFGFGLIAVLVGITYGLQPYGGHTMGWTSPTVLGAMIGGVVLLIAFGVVENRVAEPMIDLRLFRIRAFAAGNIVNLLASMSRGGLQFMLIIWLQGIWLPLHGYSYADTPLWAGIYMLPLTLGFLIAGPLSGAVSDRFGARAFATGGLLVVAATFLGLLMLPANFNYVVFAALLAVNGIGTGLMAAPNAAAIMNSVPATARGAASGVRATGMNAGQVISIGAFFSLMAVGLAGSLPAAMSSGLQAHGVPASVADTAAHTPPVGTLFAAFLGDNPVTRLLTNIDPGLIASLPAGDRATLTGKTFFPQLISGPFHSGLEVVFTAAIVMTLIAAGASLLRGKRYIHDEHHVSPAEGLAAEGAALGGVLGEEEAFQEATRR